VEREPKRPTSRQIALACALACDEKKAEDVAILDVGKLTIICDYFVIATMMSERQAAAIAEDLRMKLKEKGVRMLGSDGLREGRWAVLDFGAVVVHLFLGELRRFYDLESLWAEAPGLRWKTPRPKRRKSAR